jgi:hypothetical protein
MQIDFLTKDAFAGKSKRAGQGHGAVCCGNPAAHPALKTFFVQCNKRHIAMQQRGDYK